MMALSPVLAGSLASLLAGLATAIGALPLLGIAGSIARYRAILLGFAGGVMLAASFFSLMLPALALLDRNATPPWASAGIVAGSLVAGGAMMMALNRLLPEPKTDSGMWDETSRRIWLFVAAITLHNAPEGMAVGVSFARDAGGEGYGTALGIGIQNIPEGFAVGCALALRYSRAAAFGGALLSGLIEPVFGTLGAILVAEFTALLPWALCMSAGAMISVVINHVAPELSENPVEPAQAGLLLGLGLMTCLDIALG